MQWTRTTKATVLWICRHLRHSAGKRGALILQLPRTHTGQKFKRPTYGNAAAVSTIDILVSTRVQQVAEWQWKRKAVETYGAITLSRVNFSGNVGHVTIFSQMLTIACSLVVRSGLHLVSSWSVAMHRNYGCRCMPIRELAQIQRSNGLWWHNIFSFVTITT